MAIAIVGFLIFFAYAAAAVFRRTRIPDVLLLVLLGIIVGPIAKLVTPADFGVVGENMGTIALAVLLFHGGATLNVESLSSTWRTTAGLTVLAFLSAAALIALGGIYLLGLPPHSAAIFGFICAGTSSAVVIPMVKGLGVDERTETVLVLESALTDVLAIVLVFALVEAGKVEGGAISGAIASSVALNLIVSPLFGIAAAFLWTAVSVRNGDNRLAPLAAIALAFVVYGATNEFGYSGGLAVLAFGFGTTNAKLLRFDRLIGGLHGRDYDALNEVEKFFFNEVIFLLKTFFFVFLGISMFLPKQADGFVTLAVLAIYAVRTVVVRFTAVPPMSLRDASFSSVMAPKGLAAAVLASMPLQAGIAGGEIIRDKTFLMVLVSIVITAVAVPLIEKGKLSWLFGPALGIRKESQQP